MKETDPIRSYKDCTRITFSHLSSSIQTATGNWELSGTFLKFPKLREIGRTTFLFFFLFFIKNFGFTFIKDLK